MDSDGKFSLYSGDLGSVEGRVADVRRSVSQLGLTKWAATSRDVATAGVSVMEGVR